MFLTALVASAGDDFAWDPITANDWAIKPDSSRGGMRAVMIFEKVISDDRAFEKGKFYQEVYRRIKVFTPEGRSFAEVSLPYIRKKEEIEELTIRTVLPDGKEIILNEDQVHESEVVKTEGVRLMQKSFSFPGVTDGCILEYRFKKRCANEQNTWLAQKSIPLLKGELTWRFITRISNPLLLSYYNLLGLVPNYIWLNSKNAWSVEVLPSKEEPEEIRFTVLSLPAFESEPYTLADEAVKIQLLCYYGPGSTIQNYWKEISEDKESGINKFIDDEDLLKEIVEKLGPPTFTSKKINATYHWVTTNIKHVSSFNDDEDLETNKTLSDVVDHGYGTTTEINILFFALLRQMNLDARMIYLMDHSNGRFIKDVKFWQFDCSAVHVNAEAGIHQFYAPGYRLIPPGLVPWYVEGTQGLFVGHPMTQFITIPPSSPETNSMRRELFLRFDSSLSLHGKIRDMRKGQSARALKLSLWKMVGAPLEERLKENIKDICPTAEIDSVSFTDLDSLSGSCLQEGTLRLPRIDRLSSHRMMLRPFTMMAQPVNPFVARERKNPIVMQYAYVKTERMTISLPAAWSVEAVPQPVNFSNQTGKLEIKATIEGNTLEVERTMTLNRAFWPESFYKDIKALYQEYERSSDVTAVLATK